MYIQMVRVFLFFITPFVIIAQPNNYSQNSVSQKINFHKNQSIQKSLAYNNTKVKLKSEKNIFSGIINKRAHTTKTKKINFLGRHYAKVKAFDAAGKKKYKIVKAVGSVIKKDIFPGISSKRAVSAKEDDSLAGQINRKLYKRSGTTKIKTRQSFNQDYTKTKEFNSKGRKVFKKVIAQKKPSDITLSKSNTKDNHIAILKKGALLVRLNTNKHLINYYVNSLELEKANNEFEKQKKENKNIIKGFQQEWSFCPVYFFYSNNYLDIKKNQFKNAFKDINQTPLNNSEKENLKDNFLIAYFGENPGSVSFDALVLTTKELKQLHNPTPRYVRTYNGLWFIKRKLKKTIRILQNKIHAYWLRKK